MEVADDVINPARLGGELLIEYFEVYGLAAPIVCIVRVEIVYQLVVDGLQSAQEHVQTLEALQNHLDLVFVVLHSLKVFLMVVELSGEHLIHIFGLDHLFDLRRPTLL